MVGFYQFFGREASVFTSIPSFEEGYYRAVFEVRREGEAMAAAETAFELVVPPPSAPTGLQATAIGLDVELTWNPNPEPAGERSAGRGAGRGPGAERRSRRL